MPVPTVMYAQEVSPSFFSPHCQRFDFFERNRGAERDRGRERDRKRGEESGVDGRGEGEGER